MEEESRSFIEWMDESGYLGPVIKIIFVSAFIIIAMGIFLFTIHYYSLAEGYEWIFHILGIISALDIFGAVSFLLFWGIEYVLWHFLVRKK